MAIEADTGLHGANESTVRPMTEADIPAADELRQIVGWNQTLEVWRTWLCLEPNGCFLALRQGRLVGTVTTTTYGQALAWIGMMLVHPEHRRQGIATLLMQRALDYLQSRGIGCIRLDATPAGRPVYEKLGFVSEWALSRWQRPAGAKAMAEQKGAAQVRQLAPGDWPGVVEIDAGGFGVPRPQLLRALAKQSRGALVWPAQGRVAGWGLLRPGANADYLGPMTCPEPEGALTLVSALIQQAGNRPVFWDVPDQNEPARGAAEALGFTPVRPLTRMRLGPDLVRSEPCAQLAIADPAVG